MRTALLIAIAMVVAPASTRAELSVSDKDAQTITHDCSKGDDMVVISTNKNKVTLTGPCKAVSLAGNDNEVIAASLGGADIGGNDNKLTVDAVDIININGNSNTVRYKKAVTAKKKVKVLNYGNKNSVKRVK
jgi:hypothetical protein